MFKETLSIIQTNVILFQLVIYNTCVNCVLLTQLIDARPYVLSEYSARETENMVNDSCSYQWFGTSMGLFCISDRFAYMRFLDDSAAQVSVMSVRSSDHCKHLTFHKDLRSEAIDK